MQYIDSFVDGGGDGGCDGNRRYSDGAWRKTPGGGMEGKISGKRWIKWGILNDSDCNNGNGSDDTIRASG